MKLYLKFGVCICVVPWKIPVTQEVHEWLQSHLGAASDDAVGSQGDAVSAWIIARGSDDPSLHGDHSNG
jgi:hypothetical protein